MSDLYNNSNVQELTPADFSNKNGQLYIKNDTFKGKPALIKFYAPWCPHCTTMKPLLEELKNKFTNIDLQIGTVNCDKHKMDKLINIQGFPTIFFVKRNTDYKKYIRLSD